jgi:hypothetical protein
MERDDDGRTVDPAAGWTDGKARLVFRDGKVAGSHYRRLPVRPHLCRGGAGGRGAEAEGQWEWRAAACPNYSGTS